MPELRQQQRADKRRERGDTVHRQQGEVILDLPGNPDGDEDQRQEEGEGVVFKRLHGAGEPAEQGGAAGKGTTEQIVQRLFERRVGDGDVFVGQNVVQQTAILFAVIVTGGLFRFDKAAAFDEPRRRLRQLPTHKQQQAGRDRRDRQHDAPDHIRVNIKRHQRGDQQNGGDNPQREHKLPAVSHHFALALRHHLHDVGKAVSHVRAHRDPGEAANNRQPVHIGRQALKNGEDREQDHRPEENFTPSELIGQPAAEQRADHRAKLGAGGGKTKQPAAGLINIFQGE